MNEHQVQIGQLKFDWFKCNPPFQDPVLAVTLVEDGDLLTSALIPPSMTVYIRALISHLWAGNNTGNPKHNSPYGGTSVKS